MDPRRAQEWENLRNTIAQWNANRLDLFELSEPNENLEFHGVMRFYYQDAGQKVATKCIRVSSTATARDTIDTLIEKFRPDMRMLSTPKFALYEIHESGEERQLAMEERPLHVQLNWHKDDREGRFLLRNLDEKIMPLKPAGESEGNFKRKLSKREKKEMKKQDKLRRMKSNNENDPSVAEKLYTELPETSFTRSISNPEAVMRRRRQQKLEKKLQQFRSRDGGPDTGGTLKIYGESLCSDVPYKTLLLSVSDTAAAVVREMLDKYGKHREDPNNFCLVQVVTQEPQQETKEYRAPTGPYKEYILDEDECPLAILMNHPPTRGSIMFHVRRRPADYQPRKRKKKPSKPTSLSDVDHSYRGHDESGLPFLVELNADGTDIRHTAPGRYNLHLNVTEVGSERSSQGGGQCLQLIGHNVYPRHCVIAHTEGIVTVTPCSREAETYVNGQRVYETTILQHGCVVQFGRVHKFRFLDPAQEERLRGRRDSLRGHDSYMESRLSGSRNNMETTFDVDGHVETRPTGNQQREQDPDTRSQRSLGRTTNYASFSRGSDPILPAVLEFREETEDAFLRAVITHLDPSSLQFKLAPTYTLYMAARFRASTHYRSELTPNERAIKLTEVLAKVSAMIQDVIQARRTDANSLAFWMANASEYLHFLKQDRHISAYSRDAQDILAESVQAAFWYLVENVQAELSGSIGHFLEDRDDANEEEGTTAEVLSVLGNTMALLRRCRVNAALTIQLFSQLFHFINMGVFNRIVPPGPVNYCSRLWGVRLKRRLSRIELWADKQGLELAADCHLGRIVQAAHLLTAPKNNVDDLTTISSTCYKLNSLQLRAMLERYEPARDEPRIPPELVNNIVRIAESTSDELARQDGRQVRLEEDRDLQLPFLLPEDGYSCDIVRGIPNGLAEFVAPLQHAGLARMNEQPTSWGYWTIYMTDQDLSRLQPRSPSAMSNRSLVQRGSGPPPGAGQPEVQLIKLHKSNTGMGLSIVAAKGAGQERLGIYIKSVVRGGAADADGRLAAGDQLLEVDGHSLIGISQEQAAEYMMKTGPVVTLRVAKQAAIFHGLTTLLSQPSPVMSRGARRASEREGIPPHGRMQSSKSVPALNSETPGGPPHHPTPTGRHQETYNPGFSLSASNTSLATPLPTQPPLSGGGGGHVRSRSVQNLLPPPGAHQPPPPPPSAHRPVSSHGHHQHPPHMSPAGGAMTRSVSEHEHLRYRPPNSSQNNLMPRYPDPHLHQSPQQPQPTPGPRGFPEQSARGFPDQSAPQQQRYDEAPPPARPPPPQGLYRESPPPPPPPPPTTHPLYRGQQQGQGQQQAGYNAGNPWDREEREKELRRRTDAARQWRDQQIAYLESLPQRSKAEQQQLDTLLLEKRFQERMELGDNDEEEDEQDQDEPSGTRQQQQQMPPLQPVLTDPGPRGAATGSLSRQERQEEMRRKQLELEAAQEAERRLLREAQRRQAEQQQQLNGAAPGHRLDSLVHQPPPPPPPERSVSYTVMAQAAAELRPPAVPPKPEVSVASVVSTKKVQFNEPPVGGSSADPDRFLDAAEQMLAGTNASSPPPADTTLNTVSTPGVIGAQEVYRDPRTRRLAMQNQQRPSGHPVPEKLTFKEKMKMFAAESGEQNTPKERTKTSSRQREIEMTGGHRLVQ